VKIVPSELEPRACETDPGVISPGVYYFRYIFSRANESKGEMFRSVDIPTFELHANQLCGSQAAYSMVMPVRFVFAKGMPRTRTERKACMVIWS
jgi:hypothetical protein